MSNSYAVTAAVYLPTPQVPGAPQNNPVVHIAGLINGDRAVYFPYWDCVQSAYIAGGSSMVQQLIAAAFVDYSNSEGVPAGTPAVPPQFPLDNNIPAPNNTGDFTNCDVALVGSWSD